MNAALQQGLGLLQQGRVEEAREVFRGAARADSANPLAHHLLGVAQMQSGELEPGLASMGRAIALNPSDAAAHGNLANGLRNAGRIEEAMAAYAQALRLDPGFVDAYVNRAVMFAGLERWEEAEQDYRRALQLHPGAPQINAVYGNLLLATGRAQAALDRYEQALALLPGLTEAWKKRGEALARLGRPQEAAASFERAVGQGADDVATLLAYGEALSKAGRTDSALQVLDRAVSREPKLAIAWTNRGAALCRLDRHAEALEDFAKAIALAPQDGRFRFNRATILLDLGLYEEAREELETAMALAPDLPQARLSAAFAHLATGRFERGWRLYEARWEVSHGRAPAAEKPPLWLGDAALDGKTILLRAEQGLGDTLQFCRYVEQVKARGARVVLRAPRPLLRLMRSLDGVDALSAEGEPLPEADLQCFLMSLPLALGLPEPYAGRAPYLSAEPGQTAAWRARLGDGARPRVGLVWTSGKRGNPEVDWVNRRRDLPLDQLRALKGVDAQFVSLQKGEPAEAQFRQAQAAGWDGPPILDVSGAIADFSDTAALMEALDLVISVDTAAAHLAGALGKPVWLLNRYDSCWRWVRGGEVSPWYPTMTIYRQTGFGQWDEVMRRVRADLEGWRA